MTIDDVKALATLARLELPPDELERMTGQLSAILAYADHIQQIDVEGVEPMAHPLDTTNVLRDDELGVSLPVDDALQNAPESGHGSNGSRFFQVPAVLE